MAGCVQGSLRCYAGNLKTPHPLSPNSPHLPSFFPEMLDEMRSVPSPSCMVSKLTSPCVALMTNGAAEGFSSDTFPHLISLFFYTLLSHRLLYPAEHLSCAGAAVGHFCSSYKWPVYGLPTSLMRPPLVLLSVTLPGERSPSPDGILHPAPPPKPCRVAHVATASLNSSL